MTKNFPFKSPLDPNSRAQPFQNYITVYVACLPCYSRDTSSRRLGVLCQVLVLYFYYESRRRSCWNFDEAVNLFKKSNTQTKKNVKESFLFVVHLCHNDMSSFYSVRRKCIFFVIIHCLLLLTYCHVCPDRLMQSIIGS